MPRNIFFPCSCDWGKSLPGAPRPTLVWCLHPILQWSHSTSCWECCSTASQCQWNIPLCMKQSFPKQMHYFLLKTTATQCPGRKLKSSLLPNINTPTVSGVSFTELLPEPHLTTSQGDIHAIWWHIEANLAWEAIVIRFKWLWWDASKPVSEKQASQQTLAIAFCIYITPFIQSIFKYQNLFAFPLTDRYNIT